MRDEPAALAPEQKILGCLLLPFFQCVRGRQMIKRVIDFDRAQMAGIVGEELRTRHSCGIKWSDPMRIMPARSPDVDSAHVFHG